MPDVDAIADLLNQGYTPDQVKARLADDGPTEAELAHARVNTGAGAPPGTEPQIPAPDAMLQTFRQARAGGASVEKATSYGFAVLVDRAVKGDPTALFDEATWKLQQAQRQGDAAYAVEAQVQQRRQGQRDYEDARAAQFLGGR